VWVEDSDVNTCRGQSATHGIPCQGACVVFKHGICLGLARTINIWGVCVYGIVGRDCIKCTTYILFWPALYVLYGLHCTCTSVVHTAHVVRVYGVHCTCAFVVHTAHVKY
jgi:hypothetical protein